MPADILIAPKGSPYPTKPPAVLEIDVGIVLNPS